MDENHNASQDPSGGNAGDRVVVANADYAVGPGRPPKEHQFKKGGPSPNPAGRPRKDITVNQDLKKLLEVGLNKKFKVNKGEKGAYLTRAELGIDQLLNQFAKGDRHARRDLIELADKFGVNLLAGQKTKIEEALQPDHQSILDSYVQRRSQESATVQGRMFAQAELRHGIVSGNPPRQIRRKTL